MTRSECVRALRAVLLPAAVAGAAARLLAPRERPPAPAPVRVHDHFSPAEIERGRAFARPQLALGLARGAMEAALLAAIARRPVRALDASLPPAAGGAAAGAAVSLTLSLAPLPLSALARRRALRVGLATQSWPGWAVDLVKANLIGAAFGALTGGVVLEVIRRWPRRWWLLAAAGSVGAGAVLAAVAPVLLDPLFNDFVPLPEGGTRDDVLALAHAAGVRVGEVYTVDASRRTTAANAYVAGLGPTKRVVLFDTLLDRYSREEVNVVVAHELAHVRGRDVPRGMAFAALVAAPVGLGVAQLAALAGPLQPVPSRLPQLMLATGAVAAPVGLIANRLSRQLERRADAFSLQLTGDAASFIAFERKIALQNLADVDPPRWLVSLLSTHPPTAERIGLALTAS